MKNYYEEKFDSLFTEFDPKKALEKIVEDLLYKSSQPKYFDYKNKFDKYQLKSKHVFITKTL